MTKKELEKVKQWEKVAYCPSCGHKKCENCAGITMSDEEVEWWNYDTAKVPNELRNKKLYCCNPECTEYGEESLFFDWVGFASEIRWSGSDPQSLEYNAEYHGEYDKRVELRESLTPNEFESQRIGMESQVSYRKIAQATYDKWLKNWQQNTAGNWVDTRSPEEKKKEAARLVRWTFVPANAGKGRKER